MTAPVLSLHKKLAQVMAEVERIPKNGKAPAAMGGFQFVQVGDAADAIRTALAKQLVSMLPTQVDVVSESEHETKSGGTMTTQTIRTTWTLTDGESGETAVIQSLGTGGDTGDKFSPKAQSNSMKYALLMGFLLSTGDDPELSDSSDRRPRSDRTISTEPTVDPFDAGLVGTAKASGKDDFEMRQSPDGHVLPFRLANGRKSWKVLARGVLAEMINDYRAGIEDKLVTCWGSFEDKTFDKKLPDGKMQKITYQVLNLERVKAGALDLTPPEEDEPDETELTPEEEGELAQLAFPVSA